MKFGSIFSTTWMAKLFSLFGVPTFDDGNGNQVVYKEAILDLSPEAQFTTGTLKVSRFGSRVQINAINGSITFPSSSGPITSAGFLPVWARPTFLQSNLYICTSSGTIARTDAETTGEFQLLFFNSSLVLTAVTTSNAASNSYNV